MLFMQNLVIKTPNSLCRSGRGIVDLQLCYFVQGALWFQKVEKIDFENRLSEPFLHANARARSSATSRARHVGAPPYTPYPRRARTPRHRSVQRSLRCADVLLCMTSTAAGMVPSGEATLTGAPPTARHWPPGQPHVAEPCRPRRACSGHRGDITTSQPTFRGYINTSPTAPRARTPPPELHHPPLPPPW
jgi:hypothetical protein